MEHLLKMKSKTILFRDPVVERVCDKFVKRSDVGYAKYGRTLDDERRGRHKDLAGYLNDGARRAYGCYTLYSSS